MVSIKALEKKGVTSEALKAAFTAEDQDPLIIAQRDRIRARITDGINQNFSNFRIYYAIDDAYNAPFNQATVTLIQALSRTSYSENDPTSEEIYSACRQLGIEVNMTDEKDPKTAKPTGKKRLTLPSFWNIIVPLVPAYVKIRAAKITNDRDQTPYFKYEPLFSTPLNRARCDLANSRFEAMTTQMGYRDIGRQCILKSLLYSVQLQFIQEEWFHVEQEDDEGKTFTVKEGLRYHLPHPTRTYWDIAHPLASLHSDTGTRFMGYWRVHRYATVLENENYWNIERMRLPSVDYRKDNGMFFNAVYSSCRISWPSASPKWNESGADREDKLQNAFYTSDWEDSAVVLTEHYEKLNPKKILGIGSYDHDVWFRFVVANTDTILYANPLPAVPAVYWGYDPDESRAMNPSLALEVLPFQDHVGNLLTQMLLSVKQNLANMVLMDMDVLGEDGQSVLEKLRNAGERTFRRLNIVPFFSSKLRKLLNRDGGARDVATTVRFPQLDTAGTLAAIRMVLEILERVLVMSAQEVAGQASHEQSAEESRNVKVSTQTRLQYTASSYDRSWDAWKQQLYAFTMQYGEDEFFGYITPNPAYTEELFKTLNIEVLETADAQGGGMKMKVKASRGTLLQLEYFASTRDGQDRTNHAAMAQAMTQFLSSVLSNQMMQQAIGPEQAIKLMNQALEQFGFPRDFQLHAQPGSSPSEQQQWVMQQLQALSQQVAEYVKKGITESQQAVMQQIGQALQPLQAELKNTAIKTAQNSLAIAKISEVLLHHDAAMTEPPAPVQSNAQPTANSVVANGSPVDTSMVGAS